MVDVANLVAAHGNRRKKEMFSPHNGMLVDPTSENVERAKTHQLDISLDWLNIAHETAVGMFWWVDITHETGNQQPTGHPITGSNDHFCLFYRFHESNPRKEREILQRVTHVRQLNGLINTQRQEQLYNVFNRDNRFLNSMTPVNHIFLFRSNIDTLNERINERNIHEIEQLSSFTATEGQFRRTVLDKTKRISVTAPTTTNTMPSANSTQGSDTSDAVQSEAEASNTKESTEIKQPPPFIKTSYPVHLIDCPEESEPNVFSSRPPDKPSDPDVTCTGKRSGKNESQSVEEEDFWIKELCLKLSDKRILEKGHWANDRIIMAVFKILRLHPCTAELGGLQDVIPAVKYGFTKENRKHFVQIINVRGNHWITLSNIKSCVDEVRIYDSFVNLNRKGKEISYPVDVEQCVCRIASPLGFVKMVVTNVQQQKGGSACGLFAISNTIALCFGKDPIMLKWNQGMLGPTLMCLLIEISHHT
ncbi:Hypothetical predicted protein [Paramuricea clavata]|uniref:Uncharacterized protein n=1 Tax=Paramuricea clavata TaxID=317549 RepID=A0A6S7ISG5_PARCT|nr:Hypothetical predicted protein [Paramuricea clavata]